MVIHKTWDTTHSKLILTTAYFQNEFVNAKINLIKTYAALGLVPLLMNLLYNNSLGEPLGNSIGKMNLVQE
jgi:hypothetical protein